MKQSSGSEIGTQFFALDDAQLRGIHWRWTLIAALGDYLDAGSIVAGGASLAMWVALFHLSPSLIGLIAAFSANGISTAVGAFIAGRLGDRFGRKFIYSVDLLIYALGVLIVIVAVNATMIIVGYMVVGLAVGADVPTSWSLIAEFAPRKARGKLMGLTNIFWYIGPIVILLLSLAFAPLGITGVRLVFGSLFVVAIIAWFLRRSLLESPRWLYNQGHPEKLDEAVAKLTQNEPSTQMSGISSPKSVKQGGGFGELFSKRFGKRLLFITPLYLLWGIPAGTYGFFLPYIFHTLGAHSAASSDFLEILWFASAIVALIVVFLPLNDRVNRRLLFAISAILCSAAFLLLVFFPISNPTVAILNVLLFGVGQGIGLWPLLRIWSVELFPTEIRNTAQGFLWAIMRLGLGLWSLFLPAMTKALGFTPVAWMLGLMFIYLLVVGGIWGPKTEGVALESI
ncbi:MAG: MFS transporter [Sulfobacillus benefaciens]|uniref:MFS transporter n=1 Tax=Sulfobacillus benefaciens TaxID=453960 RepID=A0A2T2XD57_9FIRM|nr:MAG: MFS transporter [Sulfobacillus benefaciens]